MNKGFKNTNNTLSSKSATFKQVADANVASSAAEKTFVSTTPKALQVKAIIALQSFQKSSAKLVTEETAFKNRDRWAKLDLAAAYLRSADHVKAEKTFESAAKVLVSINPQGQSVVYQAQSVVKAVSTTATPAVQTARKTSVAAKR